LKAKVTNAGVLAAQQRAIPSHPAQPSKAATVTAFAQYKGTKLPVEARATRRGGFLPGF